MGRELSRLVERHGARPINVPALCEAPELSPEERQDILSQLISGRPEVVVFMTGVAVSLLFELAEQSGRRAELVEALRATTTVCRGPKPTAALRGFGVPPTLAARDPYTTAELIDALSGIELEQRRVLLFHYGERSATLAETLLARRARLQESWLYRWRMPEDRGDLEALVRHLVSGQVDALAITCQVQFRHLMEVAADIGLEERLVQALDQRVAVAAIGPTCHAIIQGYGVRVDVMPGQPKMGPFVRALLVHLEHRARKSEPGRARLSVLPGAAGPST